MQFDIKFFLRTTMFFAIVFFFSPNNLGQQSTIWTLKAIISFPLTPVIRPEAKKCSHVEAISMNNVPHSLVQPRFLRQPFMLSQQPPASPLTMHNYRFQSLHETSNHIITA